MSEDNPKTIWERLVEVITSIINLAKSNWSGLAMLFWDYEERKILNEKIKADEIKLNEELKSNEIESLKKYNNIPDSVIIMSFADQGGDNDKEGGSSGSSKPE